MNYYLNRYGLRDQLITDLPPDDLGIVVVIPCCNETCLLDALNSLLACVLPSCSVEVIVVINASENAGKAVVGQNEKTYRAAIEWTKMHPNNGLTFHFIIENKLPKKHAGVGLARKIGMDESVRRFDLANNQNGIIVCFDADALCEKSYLVEIEKNFKTYPKSPACSIHFEHPIARNEFSDAIYNGIIQYELHLRYYKNGLSFANLPYAYHTIGSSMAVRNEVYQKQNGMNKRKAGEDFYFLQKLIPLGDFSELKTTKVIPSPRVSDRVPFGTGKAMQSWLDRGEKEMLSYHPQSFNDLKVFIAALPDLYKGKITMPKTVEAFLSTIDFRNNFIKIKENSKSEKHFEEVFFKWFNAFKVLKYMHFARDNYYPDVSIFEGANELLFMLGRAKESTNKDLLLTYRKIDLL